MRFEEALTSLREGYHVRRSGWNVVCIAWPPGSSSIIAFWASGYSHPWIPDLNSIQAEDWLLFPKNTQLKKTAASCSN